MTRLNTKMLLRAYAAGIFPMADSRDADELFWVEPRDRAIIPLDRFHLSRSLAKRLRADAFTVTRDDDFAAVISACADRPETWINSDIEQGMLALHDAGHAHSIEVRSRSGELVGGLYGVRLGRAFFGESMFSRATDASKVALAWLIARLKVGHFTLLDCQFMTDHLASFGAVTVSRDDYVALLSAAIGVTGSGAGAAGSAAVGSAADWDADARDPLPLPDFLALDLLLDATASAADTGASGQLIVQLLGQTS